MRAIRYLLLIVASLVCLGCDSQSSSDDNANGGAKTQVPVSPEEKPASPGPAKTQLEPPVEIDRHKVESLKSDFAVNADLILKELAEQSPNARKAKLQKLLGEDRVADFGDFSDATIREILTECVAEVTALTELQIKE